jgi:hypothetical protein
VTEREAWLAANHRHLVACVAETRARLAAAARGERGFEPTAEIAAVARLERELGGDCALGILAARFGLTRFERQVVVLALAPELDAEIASHCAAAAGEPRRAYPTFALALAVLPLAHWDAITTDRPLRRFRMLQPSFDEGLAYCRLRLEERIVHFLTGTQTREERLLGVIEPLLGGGDELAQSHRVLAERIAAAWSRPDLTPLVQLCGGEPGAKEALLGAVCGGLLLNLYVLRAIDVPLNAADREALARLWDREARLVNGALLIQCEDSDHADQVRAAAAFAERAGSFVAVASRDPLRFQRRLALRLDVDRPAAGEQSALWRGVLGPVADQLNGQIGGLVAQFNLSLTGMRAAAAEVAQRLGDGEADLPAALWDACRAQARPRMDDLAQRIAPAASWDDIVLPAEQLRLLRDVAAHVRQRARVYEEWGFGKRGARGLGISALFAGASGTGKTMAAEVIAAELRLDLYRVDLSQVVSKYIGETEKNLRRIFDAAEEGGAVLLFDEADALFGKRSEVKDSHDRYANLEVSYLLQRMEQYRGLAILTTNIRSALDIAFLRRLRFIVEFPFPGPVERAEIWRRIFPPATPTRDLDVARLARLNVPGGVIRNIALNAAFLAADRGEAVAMRHLRHAVEIEFLKLERPLSDAEVGGWT